MKKIIFSLLFLFIPFVCFAAQDDSMQVINTGDWALKIPFGNSFDYNNILVTRAVDGDTLVLASGERVRLIGIDTPEMHESDKLWRDAQRTNQSPTAIQAMGRRAYEFTKGLVEGKSVRLEFDKQRMDKYKRLLAYVYLLDGTFVNAEIVKAGYASLMNIPPDDKYAVLFKKLYDEARQEKRGLWQ